MKRTIMLLSIGLSLLFIQLDPSAVCAQGKKFEVGIQLNGFVPAESQIQGYSEFLYPPNSDVPVSLNATGFGDGSGMDLYGTYYFSSWGLKLSTGLRMFNNTLALPDNFQSSENKLAVGLVKLTLVDRLILPNSNFTPYCGMGIGYVYAKWDQKVFLSGIPQTSLQGNVNMVDWHFMTGFTFPVYYDILFNGEIEYCMEPANWKIHDVVTNDVMKLNDVNIGGVALKAGLAYQF